MKTERYETSVLNRDLDDYSKAIKRMADVAPFLHALMGIMSEAGELSDQLKRHTIYGTELNNQNVAEELGDILWYVTLAALYLGLDLERIMEVNEAKLQERYGDGFDANRAVNRNISREQEAMNQNLFDGIGSKHEG